MGSSYVRTMHIANAIAAGGKTPPKGSQLLQLGTRVRLPWPSATVFRGYTLPNDLAGSLPPMVMLAPSHKRLRVS